MSTCILAWFPGCLQEEKQPENDSTRVSLGSNSNSIICLSSHGTDGMRTDSMLLNHPTADVSQREQRGIPVDGDMIAPTIQNQSVSQPLPVRNREQTTRESRHNGPKARHRDGSVQSMGRDIRYWVSPFTSDPWGEHGHPDVELKTPPPPPGYDMQPHTLQEPGAMVVG